jgi:glutathione gamma-glutamylcysteinyltransferase
MDETLYRRPLPADAIAFSSPAGREVFKEAMAMGGLEGYFPLAEQFHTQSDPAFCGLGSLVVALNALGIDPGRLWKGPWRWFTEELLDCCVPLAEVRERGLDLDELTCLARCNGARVDLHRADAGNLAAWRAALAGASGGVGANAGANVIVASYHRAAMGQTGGGHFSPVGGYHAIRDLALVMDVARFKYPPHWVSVERLWQAMQPVDPTTDRARGWMVLTRRTQGVALGFSLRCDGDSWRGLADRLTAAVAQLESAADLGALARAIAPLTSHLQLRAPTAAAHLQALASARAALHGLGAYAKVVDAIGPERAEAVTVLLLALADRLSPEHRASLASPGDGGPLSSELNNVRAQLEALLDHGLETPRLCR